MIRSNLFDHSKAYMHFKGFTEITNTAAEGAPVNNTNKKVTFKVCAPFTYCISEISNI